jgi:hypothetical protein
MWSVSRKEYNSLANEKYKTHLQDVDRQDEEAMSQAMKNIRGDLALKDVEGVQDRAAAGGLMKAAKQQFTNLVFIFLSLGF